MGTKERKTPVPAPRISLYTRLAHRELSVSRSTVFICVGDTRGWFFYTRGTCLGVPAAAVVTAAGCRRVWELLDAGASASHLLVGVCREPRSTPVRPRPAPCTRPPWRASAAPTSGPSGLPKPCMDSLSIRSCTCCWPGTICKLSSAPTTPRVRPPSMPASSICRCALLPLRPLLPLHPPQSDTSPSTSPSRNPAWTPWRLSPFSCSTALRHAPAPSRCALPSTSSQRPPQPTYSSPCLGPRGPGPARAYRCRLPLSRAYRYRLALAMSYR